MPDLGGSPSRGRGGGLRLLCVDTGGWIHIAYADDDTVDCAAAVRRRVGFLLRNPHIIPTYSLVECNCECVAMWCKTLGDINDALNTTVNTLISTPCSRFSKI